MVLAPAPAMAEHEGEMTARILVADDQADILQALALLLSDAGYEVDVVKSPRDVVARVDRSVYDLVLMDLNYTRDTTSAREGLGLLQDLHVRVPGLPVVVMTGWGTIDIAVEAMRRGAKSFVQKPWDDTALIDLVRREIADARSSRRRDATTAKEHEEAQLIQRALLPAAMPAVSGCDLAARWIPARGVGGDCYDVLGFSETRVGVAIADVIGKGLPAALLMSNLQAAVRALATPTTGPAELCRDVNRLLHRNIAVGKFVTFCYATIDRTAGTIEFCNAGHNPPILARADGRVERLSSTGLVLGVSKDSSYSTGVLAVHPGDRIVWFTDGLTEARSPNAEYFSDERLVELVAAGRRHSAEDLADLLVAAARTWSSERLDDDLTVVAMAVQ